MSEALLPAHLSELPLFPLPNLIFFPGTLLPLHIFEPRYRSMVQHCLDKRWPLGVVRIQEGQEDAQPGAPPLESVLGAGHIVRQQRLADGRFNIVLEGLARVQIVQELPQTQPFRQARCVLLEDQWPERRGPVEDQARSIIALASTLAQRWPSAGGVLGAVLSRQPDPAGLADGLGALVLPSPGERQALLQCLDVEERLNRVMERLLALLASTNADEA